MQAFLGAVGSYRPWIAAFGELAKPLLNSIHQDQAKPLQWNVDQMTAFEKLKRALLTAPTLGLPNDDKHFTLYIHEREGTASGVLTQEWGRGEAGATKACSILLYAIRSSHTRIYPLHVCCGCHHYFNRQK